jgi:hypothetical protein
MRGAWQPRGGYRGGQYRGRGRGYGSAAGGDEDGAEAPSATRMKASEWPSRNEAMGLLERFSRFYLGEGQNPSVKTETLPVMDRAIFHQFYLNESTVKLSRADLEVNPKNVSKRIVKSLFEIMTNGALRAHKCGTGLILVDRALTIRHDAERPELNSNEGQLVFWQAAKNPIILLNRMPDSNSINTGEYISCYPSLPAKHSTKGCACGSEMMNNNMAYCYFSAICLPKAMLMFPETAVYPETKFSVNETPILMNRSITYGGPVSTAATVAPKMMMRQPLARIKRDAMRPAQVPGSHMNLLVYPNVLKRLCCELSKPDFQCFRKHFTRDGGESGPIDCYRFQSEDEQLLCSDVRYLNKGSMDYIMSNSVHVSPFSGVMSCPYCSEAIRVGGIHTLIRHLVKCHKRLRLSFFTCPVCLNTAVSDWASFVPHWEKVHRGASALITCLYETSCHSRHAWGMAMTSVIEMGDFLASEPAADWEAESNTTVWGGYVPYAPGQNKVLVELVGKNQERLVPQCLVTELDNMASERLAHRLAQEESAKMRKTTADKRQAPEPEANTAESYVLVARKKLRQQASSTCARQQPVVPMPGTPVAPPNVRPEQSVSSMIDIELLHMIEAARIAEANSTAAGDVLMHEARRAAELVQDEFMDSPGDGVVGDGAVDEGILDEADEDSGVDERVRDEI